MFLLGFLLGILFAFLALYIPLFIRKESLVCVMHGYDGSIKPMTNCADCWAVWEKTMKYKVFRCHSCGYSGKVTGLSCPRCDSEDIVIWD